VPNAIIVVELPARVDRQAGRDSAARDPPTAPSRPPSRLLLQSHHPGHGT